VLRLGLADAAATGRQLEAMLAGPAPLLVQAIAVGGRRAFACEIPNNPVALAPAAAIRDSEMWVAASATLLEQALESDGPPLEDPDRAAPLFFRFDAARLVAVLAETYLPRVLDERTGGERPVLDPAQLPRTGELARNLGSGEITARMDGDAVVVVQHSKVGGVQNTLLAPIAALAFLESVGSTLEQLRVEVESDLCARRLMQIKGALEAYRSCFGGGSRYPRSLSELYMTGLIEDRRTLLVPSDAAPEILHYEDERGESCELRVSYRLIDNSRITIENRPCFFTRQERTGTGSVRYLPGRRDVALQRGPVRPALRRSPIGQDQPVFGVTSAGMSRNLETGASSTRENRIVDPKDWQHVLESIPPDLIDLRPGRRNSVSRRPRNIWAAYFRRATAASCAPATAVASVIP
jgi:hypothetical protein